MKFQYLLASCLLVQSVDVLGNDCTKLPLRFHCLYGFGETWGRGKTDDYEYAVSRFADLPQILEQD